MGLFDSLRKGKGQPAEERIAFSGLQVWIDRRRSGLEKSLEEGFSSYRKKLQDAVKGINEGLKELQKAQVSRNLQQRIGAIVSSSKNNYVSGMEKALLGIDVAEKPAQVLESLEKALAEMKSLDLKYSERVAFGFPEKLSGVKKELNKLVDVLNGIRKSMGETKSDIDVLTALEAEMRDVSAEIEGITALEGRKARLVEDVKIIKADIGRKESEIESLEASDKAERAGSMRRELASLNEKRQEIENAMLNVLGPLKRAFKMYARAVSDGKANGNPNAKKYAEDPVGVYLRGDNNLPEVLAGMQKALQAKLLETDEVEIEKTLKKIRNISFSYTEKLRSEYISLASAMRGLDVRIAELDVSEDVEKLKRETEGLSARAADCSREIEKADKEIESEVGKVHGIKMDLSEKATAIAGHRVSVI